MKRDVDIIRKEQIEKMAKDFCRVPCVCQKSRIDCDKTCEIYIFASKVYDAHFRKADDVRTETAKEILCRLWGYGDRDEALRRYLLEIADDYDVEVKE